MTYQEYKALCEVPLFRAYRRLLRDKMESLLIEIAEQVHAGAVEDARRDAGRLAGVRWCESEMVTEEWWSEYMEDEEAKQA